jgi:hypothetical protein
LFGEILVKILITLLESSSRNDFLTHSQHPTQESNARKAGFREEM